MASILHRAAPVVALLLSATADGQRVRGVVVDLGDVPVPGAVVQLLDSASHVAARSLTNERGEFTVNAGRPGTFRVSTLRIGYRPTVSEPITLALGAEVTRRLMLAGVRVVLDTMRVSDRSVCRAFSDSGAATYAVWEQIRGALTATQLTAATKSFAATTVLYERALDAGGRRVRQQTAYIRSDYVTQLWAAASPDSLHRAGYVVTDRQNVVTYYAPGLDMLLASVFVEDHCFRLTTDRDRLGIVFEPTRDRRDVPEIRGTLWVDRKSSELRSMEFRYVNLEREQENVAGGDMTFARMSNAQWVISAWNIRMPVLEQLVNQRIPELRVAEVKAQGAMLSIARRGADTIWSRPPLVLGGTVVDSLSGDPIAGARVALDGTRLAGTSDARGRFAILNVLPGLYSLDIATPSLDSVRAVHRSSIAFTDSAQPIQIRVPSAAEFMRLACGGARMEYPGMITGTVDLRGDSSAARGLKVAAEWSVIQLKGDRNSPHVQALRRSVTAGVDARGQFKLCGVPLNTEMSVYAELANATVTDAAPIKIPAEGRVARVDLLLDLTTVRGGVLSGTVFADSSDRPLAGAEIIFPDLSKSTLADAGGAFKLTGIPAGEHHLVVRSIGYAPLDTRLTFALNQSIDRRVFLQRAVVLDSVVSTARNATTDFDESRRLGLGHFLTRTDLAPQDMRPLAGVLATVPGLGIVHGRANRAFVMSRRATPSIQACGTPRTGALPSGGAMYCPDQTEMRDGIVAACYAQVYLDDALMNPGKPTEPFNLNSLQVDQLESIEFYAGPAQTPAKYMRLNSPCGVLVLHTRRFKP